MTSAGGVPQALSGPNYKPSTSTNAVSEGGLELIGRGVHGSTRASLTAAHCWNLSLAVAERSHLNAPGIICGGSSRVSPDRRSRPSGAVTFSHKGGPPHALTTLRRPLACDLTRRSPATQSTLSPPQPISPPPRRVLCPQCWAPAGRCCTFSGPPGDHLARYVTAVKLGLLSRDELAAVVGGLAVIADHVVILECAA